MNLSFNKSDNALNKFNFNTSTNQVLWGEYPNASIWKISETYMLTVKQGKFKINNSNLEFIVKYSNEELFIYDCDSFEVVGRYLLDSSTILAENPIVPAISNTTKFQLNKSTYITLNNSKGLISVNDEISYITKTDDVGTAKRYTTSKGDTLTIKKNEAKWNGIQINFL